MIKFKKALGNIIMFGRILPMVVLACCLASSFKGYKEDDLPRGQGDGGGASRASLHYSMR